VPPPPRSPLFPYTTLFRSDLQLALVVAGLGEAGRDQDRARDLLLAALDQRLRDELGRDREHRDVDDAGHVLDRLEGLAPHDLVRSEEHTSELQSRSDLVCR